MKAARILKERVAADQITTGVLATDLLWPGLVECLICAGLDYLIIDQEHGVHEDKLVAEVCALGRMVDFPVIVRPIDCAYATIRKAIDRGPCGFLLPGIESAEELDQVRGAIYMPPRGRRRPGGPGNAWVSSFHYDRWREEVEDDFVVLPQIETRQGIANVEAIAAHELTTAIAIGPYDLSADLGVCFDMDHDQVQDAVTAIHAAGAKAGKTMWRIGDGPTLVAQGFHFLCVAEPMHFLRQKLAELDAVTKDT